MAEIPEFNRPTDGQMTAIWRAIRMADDPSFSVGQKMDVLVRLEDIILSCLKRQEQTEEVRDQLATGKLKLVDDLARAAMATFTEAAAPTTGPVKAVRRGRPRKSV